MDDPKSRHQQFDEAYWAAQHTEVQAMRNMPEPDAFDPKALRRLVGMDLAMKGFIIDEEIHILNFQPWQIMAARIRYGFTWVPNALQPNVSIAPGLGGVPTALPYDPFNPPPGSVRPISINPADYPPFLKPKPPAPVLDPFATISPVGHALIGVANGFVSQNWDHYVIGAITGQGGVPSDARGTFQKQALPSLFYQTIIWRLTPSVNVAVEETEAKPRTP